MGMESYFVKVCFSKSEKKNFLDSLQNFKLKVRTEKDEFFLDDVFILRIENDNDVLCEASIEGCFSWFEESIQQLFEIIKRIADNVDSLQVKRPDDIELTLSKEMFREAMLGIYQEKFSYFKTKYKDIDVKLPPDKAFYDYLRKQEKKSLLKNLFGK